MRTEEDSVKKLLKACKTGDLERVQILVKLKSTHASEGLDLCYSALMGHQNLVEFFIDELNRDIHVYGDMPLCYAAKNGHQDVVSYLLAKGADISAGKNKPLCWALMSGHMHVVDMLLAQGANSDFVDESLLAVVCERGHLEAVKLLVEVFKLDANADGFSALHYALLNQNHTVLDYLLSIPGINILFEDNWSVKTSAQRGWVPALRSLMKAGNFKGLTDDLLRLSVRNKHLAGIRFLVEQQGASVSKLTTDDLKSFKPESPEEQKILKYLKRKSEN